MLGLAVGDAMGDIGRDPEFRTRHGLATHMPADARSTDDTDGPELAWEDEESPYLHGQIGLSNYPGCHTRYESVAINPGAPLSS